MTVAEFVAERTDEMELVTRDRTLAPDIGETNYPACMRVRSICRSTAWSAAAIAWQ